MPRNSCQCGSCGLKVCLKHRFEDQHECHPISCHTAAGVLESCKIDFVENVVKGAEFCNGPEYLFAVSMVDECTKWLWGKFSRLQGRLVVVWDVVLVDAPMVICV